MLPSVQFSRSVLSDSLWPHESQHARPPRPSPAPGVYSNSCASSRWCHPAISSSVAPFSSCRQSAPHIYWTLYILHFINILFWVPCSLQDLSSSTRDWIRLLAAESTKSSPLGHQGTSYIIHFTLGLKRKGESSVHCKLISVPGGISAKCGLALSMTLVRVSIFRGSWARQKRLIQAAAFQHECCAGITISALQR